MQDPQGSSSASLPPSEPSPSLPSQPSGSLSTSASPSTRTLPAREEIFASTLSGARSPPLLPPLASDPNPRTLPPARSLPGYVAAEGAARRLQRLRALRERLPRPPDAQATPVTMGLNLSTVDAAGEPEGGAAILDGTHVANGGLTPERAAALRALYFEELAGRCDGSNDGIRSKGRKGKAKAVDWEGFLRYADEKEQGAPIDHPPAQTSDSSQYHTHEQEHEHDREHESDEEEEGFHPFGGHAFQFLLAGGIAGVVSRTATAPFDRLKVYLMTAAPEQLTGARPLVKEAIVALKNGGTEAGVAAAVSTAQQGSRVVGRAVASLYRGGGIRAFWVGNGLNTMKILPESAIKFLSYETSKRIFAKYVDGVEDSRDISGISRFISGGIGGITSQLTIYPIETLKTQLMSTKGGAKRNLLVSAQQVYALGGVPAFYRGLVVGLVGVFPYSAIDMSTFEALKNAYSKSTGHEDPSVLAMLAFGSISGSVGATAVYPLNLVRTRLQASGSSGHPQRYTGMMDVVNITYAREGWKGFYKGLVPTLAKVIPAVSISYVVYEKSKRAFGVA